MSKNSLIVVTISIASILFFLAIILDITPYLRGPTDTILESRWPYYFINTWHKAWLPILISTCIILLYSKISIENKNLTKNKEYLYTGCLVILIFLFQLSLIYFSRFGITILFRRLVDPGINGLFSSVIKVKKTESLLQFTDIFYKLDQHAKGDPPGSLLILRGIINFFENSPSATNMLSRFTRAPVNKEAQKLWKPLSQAQRVAAVFSAFLFHFLATITIIPIYFLTKRIFNDKIAVRASILYAIIPSISFFALILDPFYSFFSVTGFLLFLLSARKGNYFLSTISGFILSVGLFFSLSILPVLGVIFMYCLILFIKKKNKEILKQITFFAFGLILFIGLLNILGFNSIKALPIIIGNQMPRMYLPWLLFNPYDFFLYLGVPVSLLFITATINKLKNIKFFMDDNSTILTSFWIIFTTLIISGISRGEVGRIWLPLMFIPLLLVSEYITNKLKFSKKHFTIILVLLFTQVIIMEEFWVPVW